MALVVVMVGSAEEPLVGVADLVAAVVVVIRSAEESLIGMADLVASCVVMVRPAKESGHTLADLSPVLIVMDGRAEESGTAGYLLRHGRTPPVLCCEGIIPWRRRRDNRSAPNCRRGRPNCQEKALLLLLKAISSRYFEMKED